MDGSEKPRGPQPDRPDQGPGQPDQTAQAAGGAEPGPDAEAAPATHPAAGLVAPRRRYGLHAFVVLFLISAALFIVTITSTLAPILLAAILATVTQPLHKRMQRHLPGRAFGAAVMTVLIVLAVLLPVGGLVYVLIERLAVALSDLAAHGWFKGDGSRWQALLAKHPTIQRFVPANLGAQVAGGIKLLAGALPGVLTSLANVAVALFLTIIATYYFLRDADWIFRRLERALPLEPRHTRAIALEFKRVGRAVILGTLGTALLQGLAAGVIYWIVGLNQALLLGALTAVAALVPAFGTSLVLVPAAGYLAATGEVARAILLIGAGLTLVGLVDNVVRPFLNRAGLELHPLLAFLGIFGGLATFGVSGLYLGPVFVALFLAVVRIYEAEIAPAAAGSASPAAPQPNLAQTLSAALSRSLRRRHRAGGER